MSEQPPFADTEWNRILVGKNIDIAFWRDMARALGENLKFWLPDESLVESQYQNDYHMAITMLNRLKHALDESRGEPPNR